MLFFDLLVFFHFFVVHNTEKSKLHFFSKRVIALTTVGINRQNTENFRFWRPFLPQNQVFIKIWKFCFLCSRMVFCVILWQTITILSYFWRDLTILSTFLISFCEGLVRQSYRKHVFAWFWDALTQAENTKDHKKYFKNNCFWWPHLVIKRVFLLFELSK